MGREGVGSYPPVSNRWSTRNLFSSRWSDRAKIQGETYMLVHTNSAGSPWNLYRMRLFPQQMQLGCAVISSSVNQKGRENTETMTTKNNTPKTAPTKIGPKPGVDAGCPACSSDSRFSEGASSNTSLA